MKVIELESGIAGALSVTPAAVPHAGESFRSAIHKAMEMAASREGARVPQTPEAASLLQPGGDGFKIQMPLLEGEYVADTGKGLPSTDLMLPVIFSELPAASVAQETMLTPPSSVQSIADNSVADAAVADAVFSATSQVVSSVELAVTTSNDAIRLTETALQRPEPELLSAAEEVLRINLDVLSTGRQVIEQTASLKEQLQTMPELKLFLSSAEQVGVEANGTPVQQLVSELDLAAIITSPPAARVEQTSNQTAPHVRTELAPQLAGQAIRQLTEVVTHDSVSSRRLNDVTITLPPENQSLIKPEVAQLQRPQTVPGLEIQLPGLIESEVQEKLNSERMMQVADQDKSLLSPTQDRSARAIGFEAFDTRVAVATSPTTNTDVSAKARPLLSTTIPLGQPGWEQEMSTRISYLVRSDQNVAEIRLQPASLGLVEVRISAEQERAEVTFFAQNTATREMLEAAIPKLRDAFAASGLVLDQVDFNQESINQQAAERGDSHSGSTETQVDDDVTEEQSAVGIVSDRLVDTFI